MSHILTQWPASAAGMLPLWGRKAQNTNTPSYGPPSQWAHTSRKFDHGLLNTSAENRSVFLSKSLFHSDTQFLPKTSISPLSSPRDSLTLLLAPPRPFPPVGWAGTITPALLPGPRAATRGVPLGAEAGTRSGPPPKGAGRQHLGAGRLRGGLREEPARGDGPAGVGRARDGAAGMGAWEGVSPRPRARRAAVPAGLSPSWSRWPSGVRSKWWTGPKVRASRRPVRHGPRGLFGAGFGGRPVRAACPSGSRSRSSPAGSRPASWQRGGRRGGGSACPAAACSLLSASAGALWALLSGLGAGRQEAGGRFSRAFPCSIPCCGRAAARFTGQCQLLSFGRGVKCVPASLTPSFPGSSHPLVGNVSILYVKQKLYKLIQVGRIH